MKTAEIFDKFLNSKIEDDEEFNSFEEYLEYMY